MEVLRTEGLPRKRAKGLEPSTSSLEGRHSAMSREHGTHEFTRVYHRQRLSQVVAVETVLMHQWVVFTTSEVVEVQYSHGTRGDRAPVGLSGLGLANEGIGNADSLGR